MAHCHPGNLLIDWYGLPKMPQCVILHHFL
jgi:hypothetical protein